MTTQVYVISEEDVEYSSTLDKSDIGLYGILVSGCWQLFDDRRVAECVADLIDKDNRRLK